MTRSIIDPITRIEGHLRIEMEVQNDKVTDAWVSGGCFRGMELVVEGRKPEDAAHIVQRICGVCPVSHSHASAIAAERSYGVSIPNNARIIRNLIEGAQFLHSHILWFYNLAALDYVNPLNALTADPADAMEIAREVGTSTNTDFVALQQRLTKFAENGQLSIFSGNWFDAEDGTAYKLPAEVDLICTAHYLEALKMQAKSSEIAALLGGKMPHVMTIIPGGTSFVPTEQKIDDLKLLVDEVYEWVSTTMLQDTLALAPSYADALTWGDGYGRYIAWGVFEGKDYQKNNISGDYQAQMRDRYLPGGVLDEFGNLSDPVESLITEYVGHSWYEGEETYTSPYFETHPDYTGYYTDPNAEEGKGEVADRYSWVKCPSYDGKPYEAGSIARLMVAYKRGVPFIVNQMNALLDATGATMDQLNSTLGRTAVRQIETLYIAGLMKEWVNELAEALKGGSTEDLEAPADSVAGGKRNDYYAEPRRKTGEGTGFWEAPRGALYHSEKVKNGKIEGYQIIIPSTWNLAPHDKDGNYGPLEQALIGLPVGDIEKPINALRTVHSYDPCTACAVHISEPATGKHFETVTSPWGVK